MKTLDSSHRIILDNFTTFERARLCFDEIEKYLWDVLTELESELPVGQSPAFKFKLNKKDNYIQATAFPNWRGTGEDLIGIGLENFDLNTLLSQGGHAYVYCNPLGDPKAQKKYGNLLRYIQALPPPPAGFTLGPQQYEGYMFSKALGNITTNTFCSRAKLKNYLREPLDTLVAWLRKNGPALAACPPPAKK